MEEKVIMVGPEVSLEGRWRPGRGGGGVVITHPHPLFGGSMDNNVVETAGRAFQTRGWATLRFNFRGVGCSSGTYGGGQAEVEDVVAAFAFLTARNLEPVCLVGYSFGAYVVAQALLNGLEAHGALLISPPIAFMDLAFLPEVPRLEQIVVGDRDELCPVADLTARLARATGPRPTPPEITVIAGADHFFYGYEEQLFQVLRDCSLSN